MDGINSDKVNINLGEGGGGGAAGMAALVAALGNRNEGSDNAALIAALGNRNDGAGSMAAIAPLLAGMNNNGMNNLWPILLLALLRGRGGLGGDDCGSPGGVSPGQAALLQTLLEGQSDLRTAVPEQTIAIQSNLAQLALGIKDGFANNKDAAQNAFTALQALLSNVNQNVSAQGCQTREIVKEDGEKTRSLITSNQIADLQRQLSVAELRASEDRQRAHTREVEINVSQNVRNNAEATAVAANIGEISHRLRCLSDGHNQLSAAVSRITQFGTGNVAVPNNSSTNQQG